MRVPVYVMCAALIVVVKTDKSSLFNGNEPPETELGQRDDPIGLELLLPRLLYAKYRQRLESSNNNYNNINNVNRQWIPFNPYPYSNVDTNDIDDQLYPDERIKRQNLERSAGGGKAPSLSIVNSLDVLRNRLLFEMGRKKTLEGMSKNRCLLGKIGKRGQMDSKDCEMAFRN